MKEKPIKILAIETSCDETATAVISVCHPELAEGSIFDSESSGSRIEYGMTGGSCSVILSNVVSSQVDIHKKTGGVVPEVAARAHIESILPVIKEALIMAKLNQKSMFDRAHIALSEVERAKVKSQNDNSKVRKNDDNLLSEITHIAVTVGPGLIGSLLVGVNTAKALAYYLGLPIVPINHIEGHIYSAMPNKNQKSKIKNQKYGFPILCLTVSGGHTSLTLMKDHGVYETIGQTVDDAAGEAFDKVAKLLSLGYPGGPEISKLAEQFREKQKSKVKNQNDKSKVKNSEQSNNEIMKQCGCLWLPRPMMKDGTFNFSFSGLKTAVLHAVRDFTDNRELRTEYWRPSVAAAFEDAVVDVLVTKTLKAAEKYQPKSIILAGGVAANRRLREEMRNQISNIKYHCCVIRHCEARGRGDLSEHKIASSPTPRNDRTIKQLGNINLLLPPIELCGDNAAMIGLAAYYHIVRGNVSSWENIRISSNLSL